MAFNGHREFCVAGFMRRSRFLMASGLGLVLSVTAFAESPRVRLASLQTGSKADLNANPDEIEPRKDLKVGAQDLPVVDRSLRGDPVVGLRPTLDTRLRSYFSEASGTDK
jgi:hypothetical protein